MSRLIYKTFPADGDIQIKPDEGDTRKVAVTVSTDKQDRDGDVIAPAGWDLDTYRKNPVILWAHDAKQPPIAKAVSIDVVNGRLESVSEFPPPGVNPMSDTIFGLVKGGFLKGVSVGFKPIESQPRPDGHGVNYNKQLLVEYSYVPVPANSDALVQAKAAGIDVQPIVEWARRLKGELEAFITKDGYGPEGTGAEGSDEGVSEEPYDGDGDEFDPDDEHRDLLEGGDEPGDDDDDDAANDVYATTLAKVRDALSGVNTMLQMLGEQASPRGVVTPANAIGVKALGLTGDGKKKKRKPRPTPSPDLVQHPGLPTVDTDNEPVQDLAPTAPPTYGPGGRIGLRGKALPPSQKCPECGMKVMLGKKTCPHCDGKMPPSKMPKAYLVWLGKQGGDGDGGMMQGSAGARCADCGAKMGGKKKCPQCGGMAAKPGSKAGAVDVTKIHNPHVVRRKGRFVVVDDDGKVYGSHPTMGRARAQVAALFANKGDDAPYDDEDLALAEASYLDWITKGDDEGQDDDDGADDDTRDDDGDDTGDSEKALLRHPATILTKILVGPSDDPPTPKTTQEIMAFNAAREALNDTLWKARSAFTDAVESIVRGGGTVEQLSQSALEFIALVSPVLEQMRSLDNTDATKATFSEIEKIGRVLSRANEAKVRDAATALAALLAQVKQDVEDEGIEIEDPADEAKAADDDLDLDVDPEAVTKMIDEQVSQFVMKTTGRLPD